MIGNNFPYPPDSEDTDSALKPDSVNKLNEEATPTVETAEATPAEEPEEMKVTPFPPACTLTQGEAVNHTGDSLGGGSSGKVMELDSSSSPNFEEIRNSLLEEFEDVFKEDLSPMDRIKGVQRIEIYE